MKNLLQINNDGVVVVIKTPSKFKKICKLFFSSSDTSLYVHFYANAKQYYYGLEHFDTGVSSLTFNFKNGKNVQKPPKLSYHQSGQVHFKLGEDKESVENVKATRLTQLSNEHIITVHILDLGIFEDCKINKNKNYCVIELKEDVKNHKLLIYGSTQDISNKYPVGIILGRDKAILFFGLLHVAPKPNEVFANQNGFYTITGWDNKAGDLNKTSDVLFLRSD